MQLAVDDVRPGSAFGTVAARALAALYLATAVMRHDLGRDRAARDVAVDLYEAVVTRLADFYTGGDVDDDAVPLYRKRWCAFPGVRLALLELVVTVLRQKSLVRHLVADTPDAMSVDDDNEGDAASLTWLEPPKLIAARHVLGDGSHSVCLGAARSLEVVLRATPMADHTARLNSWALPRRLPGTTAEDIVSAAAVWMAVACASPVVLVEATHHLVYTLVHGPLRRMAVRMTLIPLTLRMVLSGAAVVEAATGQAPRVRAWLSSVLEAHTHTDARIAVAALQAHIVATALLGDKGRVIPAGHAAVALPPPSDLRAKVRLDPARTVQRAGVAPLVVRAVLAHDRPALDELVGWTTRPPVDLHVARTALLRMVRPSSAPRSAPSVLTHVRQTDVWPRVLAVLLALDDAHAQTTTKWLQTLLPVRQGVAALVRTVGRCHLTTSSAQTLDVQNDLVLHEAAVVRELLALTWDDRSFVTVTGVDAAPLTAALRASTPTVPTLLDGLRGDPPAVAAAPLAVLRALQRLAATAAATDVSGWLAHRRDDTVVETLTDLHRRIEHAPLPLDRAHAFLAYRWVRPFLLPGVLASAYLGLGHALLGAGAGAASARADIRGVPPVGPPHRGHVGKPCCATGRWGR
jgi:hypothetical protein